MCSLRRVNIPEVVAEVGRTFASSYPQALETISIVQEIEMKEAIWSHDYIHFLNYYLRSATIDPGSEYKALREEKVDLIM